MICNLVDPKYMVDQHILAERRGFFLVPSLLERRYTRYYGGVDLEEKIREEIPFSYAFGKGHTAFWLDKMKFFDDRFNTLSEEIKLRGFDIKDVKLDMSIAKEIGFYNDWEPFEIEMAISEHRIYNKLEKRPQVFRYYGRPINRTFIHEHYTKYVELWSQV